VLAESLAAAIRWFVLATAARRERKARVHHSTMLIHTSMLAAAHERLSEPVNAYLAQLREGVIAGKPSVTDQLRSQWEQESSRIPAETFGMTRVSWHDLAGQVPAVLGDIEVVIDNYLSTQRLTYSDEEPTTAVVIGGNTLSRGLTLEGLTCSYFVRAASAYDTLLQMGRWFGYRHGYEDLARVWMTQDLEEWFFDLATVEEEIRREIRRYEDEAEAVAPSELPVKIRSHPAMAITSAAKMRSAIPARISFSRSREQTILFNHRDRDWLSHNIAATRQFLAKASNLTAVNSGKNPRGRPLLESVPSSLVKDFLSHYHFHERAYRMRADLLAGYINEQIKQGFLHYWNVVIVSHPNSNNGTLDIGLRDKVNLIERSRLDMPGIAHANIKALVTAIDRISDLALPTEEVRRMLGNSLTDERLLGLREDVLGPTGLLCVYPISKDSQPRSNRKRVGQRARLPLDAVEHVIGLGLFFPEARGEDAGFTYYSADLSSEAVEADETELDAIDAADEAAGEAQADEADPQT
jgi:hypothetical protein